MLIQMAVLKLPEAPDLDQKPRTVQGESDPNKLYLAVGCVLSAWEMLESSLAFLYCQLIESGNYTAYRSYGWIQSPETRAHVLCEALEHTVGHLHLRNWGDREIGIKFTSAYRQASTRRNHFAHGVVTGLAQDDGNTAIFFLVPSHYSTKDNWSPVKVAHGAQKSYSFDDPFAKYGFQFRYNASMIDSFRAYVQELESFSRSLQHSLDNARKAGKEEYDMEMQRKQAQQ